MRQGAFAAGQGQLVEQGAKQGAGFGKHIGLMGQRLGGGLHNACD